MHTPKPSVFLHLGAGSTHGMSGRHGQRILVCEGRVALALPVQWLAGGPHQPQRVLCAGECHLVDTAGWLQLTPLGAPACVRLLPPAPGRFARVWSWACRLLGLRPRRLDDLRPLA